MSEQESVTRVLTPHDRLVASRLNTIYTRKKRALGITQESLAKKLGFTNQSTVSCYLRGHIALRNAQTLLKFANELEVDPKEIDPKFNIRYPHQIPENQLELPVFTVDGSPASRASKHLGIITAGHFGVELGKQYAPIYPQGTLMLCSKEAPLKKGHFAYVDFGNIGGIFCLDEVTRRSATLSTPEAFVLCRDWHLQPRRKQLSDDEVEFFFPTEPRQVNLNTIKSVTRVVAFELP